MKSFLTVVVSYFSVVLLGLTVESGCAALQKITPADRASGYEREAKAVAVLCKAYAFDRSAGLTPEVPSMTALCGGK